MRIRGAAAVGRLLIVTITSVMAACGSPGPSAPAPQVSATPSALATSASSEGPSSAVPDGFPVIAGAGSVTFPADRNLLARWLTDANGAQVYDFYVEALPPAGFEIEQVAPGGAAAVIGFRAPDGRLLEIALTASDGGTQIDLRVPGS
ncbi:MAG TPA: VOC family protein [Candidatus Limnocylindria bacterium]|nr:VOC family protein [Candidatus Limnocylindria bacterium]